MALSALWAGPYPPEPGPADCIMDEASSATSPSSLLERAVRARPSSRAIAWGAAALLGAIAYRSLHDKFVRAVLGESDLPAPVEQVHLMEVIAAAYRSAREGREIHLGEG